MMRTWKDENRPMPRRSPQRMTVNWVGAKTLSVQKALSHHRKEPPVHVETEIGTRVLVTSVGGELGAVLGSHKAATRRNDP